MDSIPFYSKDLIKMLDEEIPERCPLPSWDDRYIWSYTGRRELINHLKAVLQRQEEEDITKCV